MTIINNLSIHDMYEYRKHSPDYAGDLVCYLYRGFDTATNTWKWMAKGTHIPFPVRSGTWFDGLTPSIMVSWMARNGWTLHTRVVMP